MSCGLFRTTVLRRLGAVRLFGFLAGGFYIFFCCEIKGFAQTNQIYVSPTGSDQNPGSLDRPVASLAQAQKLARAHQARSSQSINVFLRDGVYYLTAPLIFTSTDSGSNPAPVVYQAYQNEKPVISGGLKLENLNWKPYKNGIMQTPVPAELKTDQLFVNGERQILARYPNYDPNKLIFHGYAADAISPQRVATWADPTGGFFHAMHPDRWGDFSYEITGKTPDGKLTLTGGWQNNRPRTAQTDFVGEVPGVHKDYRFVENIFEELDAPGEWFLDGKSHTLYFYHNDRQGFRSSHHYFRLISQPENSPLAAGNDPQAGKLIHDI